MAPEFKREMGLHWKRLLGKLFQRQNQQNLVTDQMWELGEYGVKIQGLSHGDLFVIFGRGGKKRMNQG